MNGNPRTTRLLVGLATTLLLVGCASGATGSPPSPTATSTSTPATNPPGQMTVGRGLHTATRLADGRVLVAGGFGTGVASLASAELYHSASDMFTATGSMAMARDGHYATLLSDGRVLMTDNSASVEIYDPETGMFSLAGSMSTAASGRTTTLLADGRVLVTGGCAPPADLASVELYDPETGTFSPTGSMAVGRERHTATLLADGRVLVTGGQSGPTGLATAELYDPKTRTFRPTGRMRAGRVLHTATLLSDGRVLVTGGVESLETWGAPLASAELYDPTTGAFTPTGSMTTARAGYTATLLADGRVLVTGGDDVPNADPVSAEMLASAELYDPTTGAFTPTGSMATARANQTATLLANGRVLVAGGAEVLTPTGPGPLLASAELYDPKTGTFSPTGP